MKRKTLFFVNETPHSTKRNRNTISHAVPTKHPVAWGMEQHGKEFRVCSLREEIISDELPAEHYVSPSIAY
jgi:hypothetical protein